MDFKVQTWYWFSHPHEGDLFYPMLYVGEGIARVDGVETNIEKQMKGLLFHEAEMPTT